LFWFGLAWFGLAWFVLAVYGLDWLDNSLKRLIFDTVRGDQP
jgi:hypothetical protein